MNKKVLFVVVFLASLALVHAASMTEINVADENDDKPWIVTFFANYVNLQNGYTQGLAERWRFEFRLNNVLHSVGVIKLTNTTATIKVLSVPQQKTLSIGEEWKIDVDIDGFYDLSVMLNGIANNKASVTIKSVMHEEVSAAPEAQPVPSAAEAPEASMARYYIIAGILAVLLIGTAWWLVKKKRYAGFASEYIND